MTNRSYSRHIANAIRSHLDAHDFHYNFDDELGVFNLLMGVGGKAKTLIYHIIIDEHNFVTNARYPLGPSSEDDPCMNTMARFLTRANNGLRNGNFELDLDEGNINFKSFCCCRGLIAPSDEMVAESIQCPAAMFDKYEAGILGILFKGMSDKEAEEHCENSKGNILSRLEELKTHLEALGAMGSEENADSVDSGNAEEGFSIEEFLRMLAENASSGNDKKTILDADSIDAE